jgi:hypothetical protein
MGCWWDLLSRHCILSLVEVGHVGHVKPNRGVWLKRGDSRLYADAGLVCTSGRSIRHEYWVLETEPRVTYDCDRQGVCLPKIAKFKLYVDAGLSLVKIGILDSLQISGLDINCSGSFIFQIKQVMHELNSNLLNVEHGKQTFLSSANSPRQQKNK